MCEKSPTTLLAACAVALIAAATHSGPSFDSAWHDGRAELDGYRLEIERYGEPRQGTAVMIFVTEPFSASQLVKADDPAADPSDVFEALKLNLVRDFQTGIYDYNTMVSVFVRSADFSPVKISFTSAEWCGHVYEELLFRPPRISSRILSYFQGESAEREIDAQPEGVTEDGLYILLRGLREPYLAPGQMRTVPFLPSAFHRRLRHEPLAWTTAEIRRLPQGERIRVPAGEFDTAIYRVEVADGRVGTFHIEEPHPHRIVRWDWGTERGDLTGSERLAYWTLHGNGDEQLLSRLGLR